jgi:RNA recognition motif. (a.k.a. RRM, RBD, or RNP domain)
MGSAHGGFMGEQDKREQAIQEYKRWLQRFSWSWFGTLKITSGAPTDAAAKRLFGIWVSEIKRVEAGCSFRWVSVLERGRMKTNRHFHVLVGGLRNRRREAESRWNFLGGNAVIDRYDPERNGLLYMLKTMGEDGDIDIDFNLPGHTVPDALRSSSAEWETEQGNEAITLRVECVSEDTNPAELRRLFSKCGQVFGVRIHSTSNNYTFALVDMSGVGASDAIEWWNGRRWRGRELKVQKGIG